MTLGLVTMRMNENGVSRMISNLNMNLLNSLSLTITTIWPHSHKI